MSKSYKYVIIEKGDFVVSTTNNMKRFVMDELGVVDYRDYLFEDDLSIYILVKNLSLFDSNRTIIYKSDYDDCDSYFNGTVIFTKMDEDGYVSLSEGDIDLIRHHMHKLANGLFEMFYSMDCMD